MPVLLAALIMNTGTKDGILENGIIMMSKQQ